MKNFFKKHFVTIITLAVAIVLSIVINCTTQISWFENIILGLVILLITTFVFDFDRYLDKIIENQNDFETHLNPSAVIDFDAVDKCAEEITHKIRNGKHNVDFVSLDIKIRTSAQNVRKPMVQLLDNFVSNKDIKLRYLTMPSARNFKSILSFIIKSHSLGKESYYALCESSIPFASFYIIDETYLIIRPPYESTDEKHYCIIEDKTIVALYHNWFNALWNNSEIIDSIDEINSYYEKIIDVVDETEQNELKSLRNKIVKLLERS